MIDPTAQYDYEERSNFLEAQRAGKKTGIDDGPPNSIIKDNDQNHGCFYCGRSLAAEYQKNKQLEWTPPWIFGLGFIWGFIIGVLCFGKRGKRDG